MCVAFVHTYCTHTTLSKSTGTSTGKRKGAHVRAHTHTHTHIHTRMHTRRHTHAHTHTHTRTHTHTHMMLISSALSLLRGCAHTHFSCLSLPLPPFFSFHSSFSLSGVSAGSAPNPIVGWLARQWVRDSGLFRRLIESMVFCWLSGLGGFRWHSEFVRDIRNKVSLARRVRDSGLFEWPIDYIQSWLSGVSDGSLSSWVPL